MSKSLVFALLFLASPQLIVAQFNMFGSMFGQQQQQQQQQPQHKFGQAYADSGVSIIPNSPCTSELELELFCRHLVSCSQYLCPGTLDCVGRAKDCPCPNVEDIKCVIPVMMVGTEDATVVCTRGQNGCAEVERFMRKGVKSKKK